MTICDDFLSTKCLMPKSVTGERKREREWGREETHGQAIQENLSSAHSVSWTYSKKSMNHNRITVARRFHCRIVVCQCGWWHTMSDSMFSDSFTCFFHTFALKRDKNETNLVVFHWNRPRLLLENTLRSLQYIYFKKWRKKNKRFFSPSLSLLIHSHSSSLLLSLRMIKDTLCSGWRWNWFSLFRSISFL